MMIDGLSALYPLRAL